MEKVQGWDLESIRGRKAIKGLPFAFFPLLI
jgi:hypothetical protein